MYPLHISSLINFSSDLGSKMSHLLASDLSVCSSETQCCRPLEELLIVSFCPGLGQDVQTYISKMHEWCGP